MNPTEKTAEQHIDEFKQAYLNIKTYEFMYSSLEMSFLPLGKIFENVELNQNDHLGIVVYQNKKYIDLITKGFFKYFNDIQKKEVYLIRLLMFHVMYEKWEEMRDQRDRYKDLLEDNL